MHGQQNIKILCTCHLNRGFIRYGKWLGAISTAVSIIVTKLGVLSDNKSESSRQITSA